MTIKEYISDLKNIDINESAVHDVEERYRMKCPEVLQRIISNSKSPVFLDNDIRIMSLTEILNASRDLHVDFIHLRMIPFVDCFDNDFAVYCLDGKWAHFNIVDQCKFDETLEFNDLFR